MNRLAAVSLFTAAVVAAGACAGREAPTSPDVVTQAVIGQGAGLAMGQSNCPKPAQRPTRSVQLTALPMSPPPVSTVGVVETDVRFTNATCEDLNMYWVKPDGTERFYWPLPAGWYNEQPTYIGHVWVLRRTDGSAYAYFRAEDYAFGVQEAYLGCVKGKNAVCN